ncbi:hypothetical protein MCELHM10_02577 [Paracoccaceae bacterium]|jgi:hypothetical protein
METVLLTEAHRRYGQFGFPSPDKIIVARRLSNEAGRYCFISHQGHLNIADGNIPLAQVGLGNGAVLMVANLRVEANSATCLELIVVGEEPWDGEEPEPIVLFLD